MSNKFSTVQEGRHAVQKNLKKAYYATSAGEIQQPVKVAARILAGKPGYSQEKQVDLLTSARNHVEEAMKASTKAKQLDVRETLKQAKLDLTQTLNIVKARQKKSA